MRWWRIRFVLLGLILCVVHVVSGTCGQTYVDPASIALLSDIVLEGKVRPGATPKTEETFSITAAVKSVLKGKELVNKGRLPKTVTITRFKVGDSDSENCIGSVQNGWTYFFFLKDIADSRGLHFEIQAMPVKKTKKLATDLKKVLCDSCAQKPSVAKLTGSAKVSIGAKITLKCKADGKPIPLFSWYKDGVLLNIEEKVRISTRKRQSTLQIKKAMLKDAGVYECRVHSVLGEARKEFTVQVKRTNHTQPCLTQTYCLNGGTCMHSPGLGITFCQCPRRFSGERCEKQEPDRILEPGRADVMFERTLIIIGIVIAVLVFIIICIVSYFLAKKGREKFEKRRNKRKSPESHQNPSTLDVDHSRTNKDTEARNRTIHANSNMKQAKWQENNPPSVHQCPHYGDNNELPQNLQHSNIKTGSNFDGNKAESRGRLAGSSSYEILEHPPPSHFITMGQVTKEKGFVTSAPAENIEMNIIPETAARNSETKCLNESQAFKNMKNGFGSIHQADTPSNKLMDQQPISQLKEHHPSQSPSPETDFKKDEVTSPLLEASSTPSESVTPSSHSSPNFIPLKLNRDVFSIDENDTAVQPLLPNHTKYFPVNRYSQPLRPFTSKSDKDLSRRLPQGSRQHNNHKINEQNFKVADELMKDLSKLSHSSTFPKSKVNGLATDSYTDSDEDSVLEVPYEKHLDLYISEDDLGLSRENLVNSSFSSINAPSRQASQEERGIPASSRPVFIRPGFRKHQSEEGSTYNKLVHKNQTFLQDGARSRSLDNPLASVDVNRDPQRLNSTVAGSPDVETYDNVHPLHLHNQMSAYDPNDVSTPWDEDETRTDYSSTFTEGEMDKLTRLKDVLPDQPAIPI